MSRDEFEKGLHGSLLSSNRPKQQKKENDMSDLVMPLQRYPKRIEGRENLNGETLTCISKSRKDESMAKERDEFENYSYLDENPKNKRIKLNTRTSPDNTTKPEIEILKDQLAAANEENERWKKVNN